MNKLAALGIGVLLALAAAACGSAAANVPAGGAAAAGANNGAATGQTEVKPALPSAIDATLTDDMKITLGSSTVAAGTVTFNVKNAGTVAHELVVIETKDVTATLPAGDEPGKVSEDGNIGETDDMDAGATKTFSVDLKPGTYLLICNEPAHYAAGMHTVLTVK